MENYALESYQRQWYLVVHGQDESTGSNGSLITPLLRCGPIPAANRWATAKDKETMGELPCSPICICAERNTTVFVRPGNYRVLLTWGTMLIGPLIIQLVGFGPKPPFHLHETVRKWSSPQMDGSIRKRASTPGYFIVGLGIGSILPVLVSQPKVENGTKDSFPKVTLKGGYMQEEIGTTAGAIWEVLHAKGELSLSQLRKQTKAKPLVFDWAIGWLARENKIEFKQQKRSIRVRLV